MSRTATFMGDSVWRDAKRTLSPAEAKALARKLVTELRPGHGLKFSTASYDDAQAILSHVTKSKRHRFIFGPAVPFAVGEVAR